MSTTQPRPFTAATDKFAFAQAFSRSELARRESDGTGRGGRRRIALRHRRSGR